GIHKYCDYYLVEAPSDARAKPQAAEGVQACDWRSPESALRKLTYENARRVLRLAIR
ncbi:MAG: hypothetical protein GWM93_10785, partial [Gemmatimonadetes bacterium]|nr:hypothetical protein [Gemmatimonadota bacterium]NIT67144.1 hypothetical protein [Gemmatimonadota bacterium]NIW75836.1 hypothetical protein [Gemmatimonadota bacterium]NIY35721.1 hypothetical protein [Gemmatimonadota bacterium]NIY43774.1 hypothetical protein [Gemmatimonadota bacterium]